MEKKKAKVVLYYIVLLDKSVEVHCSTKPRRELTDKGVIFVSKKEYERLMNDYEIFLFDYNLKCKISKNEAYWLQEVPAYHTLNIKQSRVLEWMDKMGVFHKKGVDSLKEALGEWRERRFEGCSNVVIKHI